MTIAEELQKAGHSTKEACKVAGISRSGYYASKRSKEAVLIEADDVELIERIKAIKLEHPFWGYRRIRAWLRYRDGIVINEKRVYRIMKENSLLVDRKLHKAKRTPQRSKPRADMPLQFWGIDMTKFMTASGWLYLVIVLDWYTKKIVGWDVSLRSKSGDWKSALEMAVTNEFPDGVKDNGLKLISDNGSQPTSTTFMRDMETLGIEQIFTSYNNPKGNADTERMMRTIKEEVIWLYEFNSIEEARQTIGRWIDNDHNKLYLYRKLGYRSPEEFEKSYAESQLSKVA